MSVTINADSIRGYISGLEKLPDDESMTLTIVRIVGDQRVLFISGRKSNWNSTLRKRIRVDRQEGEIKTPLKNLRILFGGKRFETPSVQVDFLNGDSHGPRMLFTHTTHPPVTLKHQGN